MMECQSTDFVTSHDGNAISRSRTRLGILVTRSFVGDRAVCRAKRLPAPVLGQRGRKVAHRSNKSSQSSDGRHALLGRHRKVIASRTVMLDTSCRPFLALSIILIAFTHCRREGTIQRYRQGVSISYPLTSLTLRRDHTPNAKSHQPLFGPLTE
jgi:hypothetical protein